MPEIEIDEELDLAADSLAKASTPEPVGPKPLWHKKGFHLPYYIQHIANDLIEGGMEESHAIATAINTVKRWARGGKAKGGSHNPKDPSVHPDTQAAASKAVAEWEATKAGAHSGAKMAIDDIEELATYLADTNGSTEYGTGIPASAHYRHAGDMNKSCQTCFFFSGGRCNYWHAYVEPTETCDEWQPGGVIQPGSKPGMTTSLAEGRGHTYSLGYVRRLGEQIGINWSDSPFMMEEFRLGLHHETQTGNVSPTDEPVKQANTVWENLKKDPEFYTKLHGIKRMQPEGSYANVRMAEDINKLNQDSENNDNINEESLNFLIGGGGAFMSDERVLAEMFLSNGGQDSGDDGIVWKPILREGIWKYSPGPGQQPTKKPITVVKDGKSDPSNLVISMSEIMKNFKNGAVEHVTIPTSHQDGVLENTGFIKDLRLSKDGNGKWVLEAAHNFTEPDVKEMTDRGTIANTSAGVLFDYIRKEDGKRFGAVLGHVALTNRPWLNGMKPFGVEASEEEGLEIMGFSEDEFSSDDSDELENELDLAATKAPYGNVTYADPGYQGDKKKRYPIDNEKHIRAAWSYINKAKNGAQYSSDQLSKIKGRIKSAMKRIGANVNMSEAELIISNEASLAALFGDEWENQVDALFSEEEPTTDKEVNQMPEDNTKDEKDTIAERLGLSEEEVKSRLARLEQLELSDKQHRIDEQCKNWQDAGKTPALVNAAKTLLMADKGATVLNLSEDGSDKALTASDVVERLVDAAPSVKLDQDKVNDKDATDGNEPDEDTSKENDKAQLSQEVRALATQIFFEETVTEEEALEAAKERLAKGKDKD